MSNENTESPKSAAPKAEGAKDGKTSSHTIISGLMHKSRVYRVGDKIELTDDEAAAYKKAKIIGKLEDVVGLKIDKEQKGGMKK